MAKNIIGKLVFHSPTSEALEHIKNAESELSKAGVTFDTGSDVNEGIILNRVWELDWSLKGAKLVK